MHLQAMICIEYFSFIRNLIINILEQVCVYFNSLGNLSSFVLIFELDHDFIYLFDWWYKLKKFLQIWNIKFSFLQIELIFGWIYIKKKNIDGRIYRCSNFPISLTDIFWCLKMIFHPFSNADCQRDSCE